MGKLFSTLESVSPSTPASGRSVLYPKSDGAWYFKDDSGTERELLDSSTLPGVANTFPRRNAGNTAFDAKTPQEVADELAALRVHFESQTASGSGNTFSNIPSWVTQIDVIWSDLSHNGAGSVAFNLQIGDSGGLENSGYVGTVCAYSSVVSSANYAGSAYALTASSGGSTVHFGRASLTKFAGNAWLLDTMSSRSDAAAGYYGAGTKTLSDVLTQLRMFPVSDSFDAGTIAIRCR